MMEIFIGMQLFILFMAAALFIVWIWAIIDIITSKFNEDFIQIIWLLIVFFLPFVGVLIYLLIGRSMKRIRPMTEEGETQKYDHLAKLKMLLDEGVISQEEFTSEKEKILNR